LPAAIAAGAPLCKNRNAAARTIHPWLYPSSVGAAERELIDMVAGRAASVNAVEGDSRQNGHELTRLSDVEQSLKG
jgi:hypothetical protein